MIKVCWRYEEYYGDYIDLSDWEDAGYDHVGNIMEYFDVSSNSSLVWAMNKF